MESKEQIEDVAEFFVKSFMETNDPEDIIEEQIIDTANAFVVDPEDLHQAVRKYLQDFTCSQPNQGYTNTMESKQAQPDSHPENPDQGRDELLVGTVAILAVLWLLIT